MFIYSRRRSWCNSEFLGFRHAAAVPGARIDKLVVFEAVSGTTRDPCRSSRLGPLVFGVECCSRHGRERGPLVLMVVFLLSLARQAIDLLGELSGGVKMLSDDPLLPLTPAIPISSRQIVVVRLDEAGYTTVFLCEYIRTAAF